MTAIAQTSMITACLAILIYIAVIVTGDYFATQENIANQNPLSQQQQFDDALHKQISTNLNYSVSGPLPTFNKSCTYCPYIF